jgi:hypothetical protein
LFTVHSANRMTTDQTRSSLFWDIKQPKLVASYRRFGTTHRSNLQGLSIPRRMPGTGGCIMIQGSVWAVTGSPSSSVSSFFRFCSSVSPSSCAFSISSHVLVATPRSSNLTGSLTLPKNQSRPTPSPISQRIHLFQAFFLDCMTLEHWIYTLSRNVSNQLGYQPTPSNISEERRSQWHHGGSLKSRTVNDLQKVWRKVVVAYGNMQTVWKDWGKLQKTSVRAVNLPAEISTRALQNLKHNRALGSG